MRNVTEIERAACTLLAKTQEHLVDEATTDLVKRFLADREGQDVTLREIGEGCDFGFGRLNAYFEEWFTECVEHDSADEWREFHSAERVDRAARVLMHNIIQYRENGDGDYSVSLGGDMSVTTSLAANIGEFYDRMVEAQYCRDHAGARRSQDW